MNFKDIVGILKRDGQPVVTVIGDYTLDKYLYVDADKDELSLETNLTAYQITHKKNYAGSGGTITNNLRALGAKVYSVGIIGNDGEGFDLLKCLKDEGADVSFMVQSEERNTPTYMKPMRLKDGPLVEMNRFDIKNFTNTPLGLQKQIITNLEQLIGISDAIIISDQFIESDCGAITAFVQQRLSELASKNENKIWYADSRSNIDKFENIILKCNHKEIANIFKVEEDTLTPEVALEYAKKLYEKNGKPVYVTLGELGSIVFDGLGAHTIPAFKVNGEIDIVGAGDACNAGIIFALTKGASYEQAALVGNAASSIVIKMIGETGAAKLDEVINLLNK